MQFKNKQFKNNWTLQTIFKNCKHDEQQKCKQLQTITNEKKKEHCKTCNNKMKKQMQQIK